MASRSLWHFNHYVEIDIATTDRRVLEDESFPRGNTTVVMWILPVENNDGILVFASN